MTAGVHSLPWADSWQKGGCEPCSVAKLEPTPISSWNARERLIYEPTARSPDPRRSCASFGSLAAPFGAMARAHADRLQDLQGRSMESH